MALIGSVIFIAAIFAYPKYNYFVPHEVVWTGKVFGAYPAGGPYRRPPSDRTLRRTGNLFTQPVKENPL